MTGAQRIHTRKLRGGRREELTVLLYQLNAPSAAAGLFGSLGPQLGGLPGARPYGQGSAAGSFGRARLSYFFQTQTFGSLDLARTRGGGRPAVSTLNSVGRRTAAKVVATP